MKLGMRISHRGSANIVLIALVAIAALLLGYYVATGKNENSKTLYEAELANKKLDTSFLTELTLDDPLGRPVALSSVLTELNIINYWATWCAPCRREMPVLQHFYESQKGKGVSVIGLTLDDPEPTERFIQEIGVSYPVVMMGEKGWELLAKSGDEKGLLPYTLMVDSEGNYLESKLGEVDMEMLLKWIKKHSSKAK